MAACAPTAIDRKARLRIAWVLQCSYNKIVKPVNKLLEGRKIFREAAECLIIAHNGRRAMKQNWCRLNRPRPHDAAWKLLDIVAKAILHREDDARMDVRAHAFPLGVCIVDVCVVLV